MTFDPIERDLDRHLREQERADALDDLIDAKVADWLADPAQVRAAFQSEDFDLENFGSVVDDCLGRVHVDRSARAEALLASVEGELRRFFYKLAPDAVADELQAAQDDADECAAEAREFSRAARYGGEY
jgi:hypothetical protein